MWGLNTTNEKRLDHELFIFRLYSFKDELQKLYRYLIDTRASFVCKLGTVKNNDLWGQLQCANKQFQVEQVDLGSSGCCLMYFYWLIFTLTYGSSCRI